MSKVANRVQAAIALHLRNRLMILKQLGHHISLYLILYLQGILRLLD